VKPKRPPGRYPRNPRGRRARLLVAVRGKASRPGRGLVRRRTATSSTLCPQQGLLQDHAERPFDLALHHAGALCKHSSTSRRWRSAGPSPASTRAWASVH